MAAARPHATQADIPARARAQLAARMIYGLRRAPLLKSMLAGARCVSSATSLIFYCLRRIARARVYLSRATRHAEARDRRELTNEQQWARAR